MGCLIFTLLMVIVAISDFYHRVVKRVGAELTRGEQM